MFGNSLSVNGCTFVQNSASEGGSIFSTSTFTLSNSIMWDNTSTESDGWSGQSFTVIDDGIHEDLWRNYATFVGVKAKFPGDPDAKETVFASALCVRGDRIPEQNLLRRCRLSGGEKRRLSGRAKGWDVNWWAAFTLAHS